MCLIMEHLMGHRAWLVPASAVQDSPGTDPAMEGQLSPLRNRRNEASMHFQVWKI